MEAKSRSADAPYSTLLVHIPHYCGRGQAVLCHEGCEREPLWAPVLALLDAVHMGYGVRGRHGRKKRGYTRQTGQAFLKGEFLLHCHHSIGRGILGGVVWGYT